MAYQPMSLQERHKHLKANMKHNVKLWGPVLERGAVTLLVGASGAGKSVFTYNLFYHLAQGKPFLGLTPPKPLRILQIDNESPDAVQFELMEKFLDASGWDMLDRDATFADLEQHIGNYDIAIVDILSTFTPVKDENDNSEAERQMLPFLALAKRHNVSIILTWHLGKDEEAKDARGASGRRAKSDITAILYNKGEDTRELYLRKTRDGNNGKSLIYKTEGTWDDHEYKLIKPLDNVESKFKVLENKLLSLIDQHDGEVSRKLVCSSLNIERDSSDWRLLDRVAKSSLKVSRSNRLGYFVRTPATPINGMLSLASKINDLNEDMRKLMSSPVEVL